MNICSLPSCEKLTSTKFCSKSCAATLNNSLSPKREPRQKVNCLRCEKEFKVGKNSKGKFCSNPCSSKYRSETILNQWLNNEISGSNNSGELIPTIRRFLLEESDNKCSCGWSTPNPTTGQVILTIDHIDGNWKNNRRENLRVLCYNCHTLTPTFGSLNRGKFPNNNRSIGSRIR